MPESTGVQGHEAEQELAARTAVLVVRMFMLHNWRWGAEDCDYIPTAEAIAEMIGELLDVSRRSGEAHTGRLRVVRGDLGTEVYLLLGGIYEGDVVVDDVLKGRGPT